MGSPSQAHSLPKGRWTILFLNWRDLNGGTQCATQLNESEYEAFLKLSNNLCSDEPTKKLCLQYYLEYKAVLSEVASD